MAINPLSLWIHFFQYSGNDWDLPRTLSKLRGLIFLKSAQKKELPSSVTRFGLLPIEIPYIKTNFNIFISFCQEKTLEKKFLNS